MNLFSRKFWCAGAFLAAILSIAACQPAPDFELLNTPDDTERVSSWQQHQGEYVIVNFFAEWCAPCLRELPELNEFHRRYHEQVTLYGVSFDPLSNEELSKLVADYSIEFPLLRTEPAPNLPFERPKMLPATYIITPDGRVEGPLLGEQTEQSLLEAVNL